ncbi:MAG: hypothetical protein AAGA61_03970 [Pseudomonadota bacterium]
MSGLFEELKRRNVVRVAAAYIVVGWLVTQIAQLLFEAFGTPDWVIKTVIVLIAIGFPFALIFAWAFELTPDGLKKTRDVDASSSITPRTGQRINYVIIGGLVVALGYFVWERQTYRAPVAAPVADIDTTTEAADTVTTVAKPTVETDEQRSIAVLPFINMSSDQEQEWFADGLTEEILNSLAKAPDLLVAARTSSFGYKGSTEPIPDIAAALGVDHVLEGSVRRGGDRLRITAQLIRASDGFHLWSETFDRAMDDVIGVQEEIAVEIAKALETTMDPEALERMMQTGTTSVAAYEAYLQGMGAFAAVAASGDRYGFLAAGEAYEEATRIDPEFAEAYWRLAVYWFLQSESNQYFAGTSDLSAEEMDLRYDEALANAIRYETDETTLLRYRAIQADDNLDFLRAADLGRQYMERRPNDEEFLSIQFNFLRSLGRADEIHQLIVDWLAERALTRETASAISQALRDPDATDLMRQFTAEALDKFGDDMTLLYQLHRLLLWAGDADSASRLVPRLQRSELDDGNRLLVDLRQACAENRLADADKLHSRILNDFPDEIALVWLAHKIRGKDDAAVALFKPYDEAGDFDTLQAYLPYPNFDITNYPNFMRAVAGQGLENRQVLDAPYACER